MLRILFLITSISFLPLWTLAQGNTYVHKEYDIEQFFANNRIGGGAFSADESKLLYSSDESGIFNVREIDVMTKESRAITQSTEESFFAIDYVPHSNDILYSADKGGNEVSHIYLLATDGTTTDLTPGEEEVANFWGWSDDKKYMYYTSNGRDPQYFDLYKMAIDGWESKMVYHNSDGVDIQDFSEDESYYALSKTLTTSSNQLWIYSTETGEKVEISDPANPGSYGSSGFSKDNSTFFYTTDKGKEFNYLVARNLKTGEEDVIYETDWSVRYSYLSETEKYRVIGINEDGRTSLKILDTTTGNAIELPEINGNVQAVRISESEQKMRMTVGLSHTPNNLYLYDMESKELTQLTETLNPDIDATHLAQATVVRYTSFDGLEIPAIYYKPNQATVDNKVPALVWVHGGPGGQSRVGYSSTIQYLVNHGYAILAVNNRGSSGYGKTFYKMDDKNHGDKDLKDCIWGKKWLQEQAYIDGDKIGIIGGSYGGYMTMAAMAFTPDEFEVGVNIFGVTNWLRTLKSIPPYWESFRNALYEELGDPNTADSVRLYNISPLFHAEQVKNPVMVLQGANDPRVLQIESDEMVEEIKKNGTHVEYVIFEDEGHGFLKKENQMEGYGKVLQFLDTHLKKE